MDLFKDCFVDKSGSPCLARKVLEINKPIVGLPKMVRSRHIIKSRLASLNLPLTFSDLMACSFLLKAGEYVRLTDYRSLWMSDAQNERLGELHWRWITSDLKDLKKNEENGLDDIAETIPYIAEHTLVTYFKPYDGCLAIRVEILDKDRDNIDRILATLKKDYDKTIRMPYSIYMADKYSKSSSSMPGIMKSLLESKMNANARKEKVVDPDFLWFMNLTFSDLGGAD